MSSIRRRHILLGIACAVLGLLVYIGIVGIGRIAELGMAQPTWNGADNATLGFGGIFVLTGNTNTWRVSGLQKAAYMVGLDLITPVPTPKTETNVEDYLAGDDPDGHTDYVKATLSYLDLLQQFIDTGYETALFFEDDVDFNVMVRHQMSILAGTFAKSQANTPNPLDPYNKAE